MPHSTRLFTCCRNARVISFLMILCSQITVWKKVPNQETKTRNPSLSVKIIGQLCHGVRVHKNNVLLNAAMVWIKMRTETQMIISQLRSQIISTEKTILLHYSSDGNARPLHDLPLIPLRACEMMTNPPRKRHLTVNNKCPGKIQCALRFKH